MADKSPQPQWLIGIGLIGLFVVIVVLLIRARSSETSGFTNVPLPLLKDDRVMEIVGAAQNIAVRVANDCQHLTLFEQELPSNARAIRFLELRFKSSPTIDANGGLALNGNFVGGGSENKSWNIPQGIVLASPEALALYGVTLGKPLKIELILCSGQLTSVEVQGRLVWTT